jgi:hypothetical protein
MIEYRTFSVDEYIDMVRPYSGMSPSDFTEFKTNIQKFRMEIFSRPQIAKQYRRLAIDSVQEMSLYTRTADSSVQYELQSAISKIDADTNLILEKELKKYTGV